MAEEGSQAESGQEAALCDPDLHQCQCPAPPEKATETAATARATSIKIMTWSVHCLRLQRHTAAFEALTGTSVTISCIDDFDEHQAEILSDAKTQTGLWDGWKFPPAIIGQLDLLGGLHDLTPFIRGDLIGAGDAATSSMAATLKWNDIFRFNRENGAVWDGKVVVIPLDGDVHSLYYRTDLFSKYNKKPPKTWEEYTELAKFFNGKYERVPGTNTTVPIAGSCVTRKDRPFYWTILVLSSMTQNQGTKSGALFDPDTMEPLLGEAFVRTLQYMEEQFVYGAENEFDGDFASVNIAMMNQGRCAMSYNWGDAYTEASKAPPTSLVSGYLSTAQTPGSASYLNRNTMMLETCTEDTCSCGTFERSTSTGGSGCINSAPYAAFTGWSGGCSSYTGEAQKLACSEFFAYVSSPDVSLVDTIPNITAGAPFISADPFRTSQTELGQWTAAGLPSESTKEYLETVKEQLSDPNVVLDMRIPATKAFQDSMNKAFREHITSIKENMDAGRVGDDLFSTDEKRWEVERRLRDEWVGIINQYNADNVGSKTLLEIYQRNLGVWNAPQVNYNYLTGIRAVGLTFAGLVMAGSLACVAWTRWNRNKRIVRASQPFFLYLICAGTLIMGSAIIPLSIDDSIASEAGCSMACMSIPWLLSVGFATAFSALFSKIYRLNKLYREAGAFRKVIVTAKDVLPPFVALMTINVALLLAWTLVDPLRWVRTDPDEFYQSYGLCMPAGSAWKVFLSLIVVLDFAALALANVQAYKARNINTQYSESSYVMMTMVSLLQALLIGLPLLILVQSNPTAKYFVWSVLIFIVTAAILLLMFVPKMMLMRQNPAARSSEHTRYSQDGRYSQTGRLCQQSATESPASVVAQSGKRSSFASSEKEKSSKRASFASSVDKEKEVKFESEEEQESVEQVYKQKMEKLKDLLDAEGIDSAALFEKAQLPHDNA